MEVKVEKAFYLTKTEGKVNKLKTLKRVIYGRAGFALLRQRLLHDT
jgi:transposase